MSSSGHFTTKPGYFRYSFAERASMELELAANPESVPAIRTLSRTALRRVRACCRSRLLLPGMHLYRENQIPDVATFLVKGKAEVLGLVHGGRDRVHLLSVSETEICPFSVSSMLSSNIYPVHAVATSYCLVLEMPCCEFKALFSKEPAIQSLFFDSCARVIALLLGTEDCS